MTKETLLMQYQSECLSALKSVVNIQKPFEKTFMDTMKLFMAIPDRINFLQLGRYGCFSEQTYRNLFETPWIGYFWSGCAGEYKRGLGIMGIGVIDIDNHECMTLGSIQTPDCKTLDNMERASLTGTAAILSVEKTRYRAYQGRWLQTHFNASLAAINLAKAACKRIGITYSISSCKSFIHNAYMLERFICVFGISPDPQVIDKLFKELILFTARTA